MMRALINLYSSPSAITWSDPKDPEISILRMNCYEYIEILIDVSPHTLLESVWQVALS
jgi:hypothetical protein